MHRTIYHKFACGLGSAAMSEKTIKPRITPNINEMNMILRLNGLDEKIPLQHAELLLTSAKFRKDLPLVILITGWNTDYNVTWNPALDKVYDAYRCRGGINFVVSGFLIFQCKCKGINEYPQNHTFL